MAANQSLGSFDRTIFVRVISHQKTDLMMAISDDLKGLMVPGRSKQELYDKLPAAITELLEAEGAKVLSVSDVTEQAELPDEFRDPGLLSAVIARAELECV